MWVSLPVFLAIFIFGTWKWFLILKITLFLFLCFVRWIFHGFREEGLYRIVRVFDLWKQSGLWPLVTFSTFYGKIHNIIIWSMIIWLENCIRTSYMQSKRGTHLWKGEMRITSGKVLFVHQWWFNLIG